VISRKLKNEIIKGNENIIKYIYISNETINLILLKINCSFTIQRTLVININLLKDQKEIFNGCDENRIITKILKTGSEHLYKEAEIGYRSHKI